MAALTVQVIMVFREDCMDFSHLVQSLNRFLFQQNKPLFWKLGTTNTIWISTQLRTKPYFLSISACIHCK